MDHPSYDRIHPEAQRVLRVRQEKGMKFFWEVSVEEAREMSATASALMCGEYAFKGQRSEVVIPSPYDENGIQAYVYKPKVTPRDCPILVYFHGGGFCVGSRQSCDIMCKMFCDRGDFIIVNVEYRLAPEHPYPAGFDDAECATKWVLQNKTTIGGSEKSRVGVSGDSAGGSLAATVAHDVPGLSFQVLIYPSLLGTDILETPSCKEFEEGPLLTKKNIKWFVDHMFPNKTGGLDERHNVTRRSKFDHLPPCLILLAEVDPLKDCGLKYRKILDDAGVHCEFYMEEKSIHSFFPQPAGYPSLVKKPYELFVDFVNRMGHPAER